MFFRAAFDRPAAALSGGDTGAGAVVFFVTPVRP